MFTIRNYTSEENLDIAKLMDFKVDVYDVINSPFLNKLNNLTVSKYYSTTDGYKDIDRISEAVYGSPFYSYYIQYYNGLQSEIVEEGTVLKLFSLEDIDSLYYDLANGII